MSDLMNFPESFENQVRECLAHLYDFANMQKIPLVQDLAPALTGLQRVQTVRQMLIDIIENLHVNREASPQSKQKRVYSVLFLKYVEEQSTQEILQQLALSERQFYREHRRAIQALSQILWEKLHTNSDHDEMSIRTEIQRAYQQTEQMVLDGHEFFEGVITSTKSLSVQQEVTVVLDIPEQPFGFYAPRVLLRQMVIWLSSHLIKQIPESKQLTLSYRKDEKQFVISFMLNSPYTSLEDSLLSNETFKHLIETLKAGFLIQEAQSIELILPIEQPTILVIDDNPDVFSLLKRFTSGFPFTIYAAHQANEGIEMARERQPILIILDVMLPGKDGWEVLQILKSHPATAAIPVYICSVLDAPDLALSLGASGFLQKPPQQSEFIHLLTHLSTG